MSLDDIKDKYVNFYTDYAFKRFFGTEANKDLLISFLNELLRGRETVTDLTYLPTEQKTDNEVEKRAVFDVYCVSETGERFMVEMQKGLQADFKDRTLYYSTFPIREQIKRGNGGYELKKVYSISILNFTFSDTRQKREQYIHRVTLMDETYKYVFNNKLQFVYIEMPKFKKKVTELKNDLDRWLYAIKHLSSLRDVPDGFESEVFTRLFELAEISRFTSSEYGFYESSLKDYRDFNNVMSTSVETGKKEGIRIGKKEGIEIGRKQGIEIGKQEGIEIGKQEGIEIGMKQNAIKTAKYLLGAEMSIDEVANATGLSESEVREIM